MSITYQYLHYFSFNISNIWCEIDSSITLLQSMLNIYLDYYCAINSYKSKRQSLITGQFVLETKWKRSDAHGNCLFHFISSFKNAITNHNYRDYKISSIRVASIGLFISLCGAYQLLFCIIVACSWSGVLNFSSIIFYYHFLINFIIIPRSYLPQ